MKLSLHVKLERDRLNKRLKKLGEFHNISCMDYKEEYLKSALWKKIKKWILERDNYTCASCGYKLPDPRALRIFKNLHVHHKSYDLDVLEGNREDQLITLCKRCHEEIEFHSDGRKRNSLDQKDEELNRITERSERFKNSRFPLTVDMSVRGKATTLKIIVPEHSEFSISLGGFLSSLVLYIYTDTKKKLRIPMPYNRKKLYQKTGLRITDSQTEKVAMRFSVDDYGACIRISSFCDYPIHELIYEKINADDNLCINEKTSNHWLHFTGNNA